MLVVMVAVAVVALVCFCRLISLLLGERVGFKSLRFSGLAGSRWLCGGGNSG